MNICDETEKWLSIDSSIHKYIIVAKSEATKE